MNRIIEVNFLPPPVEKTEEKPRILLIDDKPRFHEPNKCFEFPNGLLSLRPESFKESSLPLLSFVTAPFHALAQRETKVAMVIR